MNGDEGQSPAAKAMDEAIDLAIEGQSPYPEQAAFVDADVATAGLEIKHFADEGIPIVLVAADGSARILTPGAAIR